MIDMTHENRFHRVANRNAVVTGVLLLCLFAVLVACGDQVQSPSDRERADSDRTLANRIIDAAIEVHGGFDELEAASMWVGEVRRHQRGDSYVITNYYRPGMVRLEQDLGNGEKSADVIGDPHCWGMRGPVSVPCSRETRENDRPRVIMEMAAQLWPLKEDDWEILAASSTDDADLVTARFIPRDSIAEFTFEKSTHMLESISIDGIKQGVSGSHLHVYSEYREFCGVQMPAHNEKSFEGEVWVAEDILSIECRPTAEEFFVRPAQVEDGTFLPGRSDSSVVACMGYDSTQVSLPASQAMLATTIRDSHYEIAGGPLRLILDVETTQLCFPVGGNADTAIAGLAIMSLPATDILSMFSLQNFGAGSLELIETLQSEAANQDMTANGPVRIFQYDNDGMGPTGEIVVELQLPVKNDTVD